MDNQTISPTAQPMPRNHIHSHHIPRTPRTYIYIACFLAVVAIGSGIWWSISQQDVVRFSTERAQVTLYATQKDNVQEVTLPRGLNDFIIRPQSITSSYKASIDNGSTNQDEVIYTTTLPRSEVTSLLQSILIDKNCNPEVVQLDTSIVRLVCSIEKDEYIATIQNDSQNQTNVSIVRIKS